MPPEQTRLLLEKAAQDEYVPDKTLDDEAAPTEIFGFHAQQAVEKLLKAVLADRNVDYPPTHRLIELIDLCRDHSIDVPVEFEAVGDLTPFAVEFRYDVFPKEPEDPIDKHQVRDLIRKFRAWVEGILSAD